MEESVALSLSLLALERAAEASENETAAQKLSLSKPTSRAVLHTLTVASQRVGLYGRQVVIFDTGHRARGKRSERALPANSITTGDIVGLYSGGGPIAGLQISGVVTRITSTQVSVAFDELSDSIDLSAYSGMIQLVKLANDVTYRRIKRALESLRSYQSGRCLHLISALFSQSPLLPPHQKYTSLLEGDLDTFPWHTPGLNSSQRRAVVSALSRPDVAVIHGPPGTGKTTTVVELILQAVDLRMKVLACAPSNIAVDNIVERLAKANAKVVRIGHPARLEHSVLEYSLDALVANSDSAGIILDVRRDIDKAFTMCMRTRSSGDKRKWRSEIKTLKSELKQREERCLKEILSNADVVLSTLTGSSRDGTLRYLPDDHFDMVVIDECAQALEASCWIPLLQAPRCVLAGDHCQLPPTILSQEAADKGLSLTLMERLVKEFGDHITSTLTTQYRMHTAIMTWPSHILYQDTLIAHDTVAHHLLSDLPNVSNEKETSIPLVFIDTAGCGVHELETEDTESKGNEGEADLVVHHIKKLRNSGVSDKDIAVIAPYSLQVELIRKRVRALSPASNSDVSSLEVHTVDGFQGREKEAVIISLTRSNDKGEYGFLKEQRRSNVAVTRARRHLCLIGDSDTVSHEPFMKGMIEHCHQNGEVWSAHEYMHDPDFEQSHYYHPKVNPKSKDEGKVIVSRKAEGRSKAKTTTKLQSKPATASSSTRNVKSSGHDDESDELRTNFMETIVNFIERSDSDVLSFPPSLTGNERKIVHELCEKFELLHVSQGQEKDRFIEVRKPQKESLPQAVPIESEMEKEDVDLVSDTAFVEPKLQICDICGQSIPLLSWELHHIQCVKILHRRQITDQMEEEMQRKLDTTEKGLQKQTKTKHVPKKSKQTRTSANDDDLDTLLAEMTLADSTCKFSKCSKSISLLSVQCRFCKDRYCMEHSLAEVHGCGDAARLQSRKDLHREQMRGGRSAGLSSVKRSQLHMKLNKKLEEKTTARQGRTESKSKGQK